MGCKWEWNNYHEYYQTECGHAFIKIEDLYSEIYADGITYCPWCGKEIDRQEERDEKVSQ